MSQMKVSHDSQVALVDSQLSQLLRNGYLEFECSLNDSLSYVQPASVDIPVGSTCYLVKEKVLPFGKKVTDLLPEITIEKKLVDDEEGVTLLKGQTYLLKCGKVDLKENQTGSLSPKSSIGRVDMMVRGIFDEIGLYDTIIGGTGAKQLWLEISPRSFNVRIKKGITLSQMMIFERIDENEENEGERSNQPEASQLLKQNLVFSKDGEPLKSKIHRGNLVLSLSLSSANAEEREDGDSESCPVCFEALPTNEVIDLSKVGYHAKDVFFRPVYLHPKRCSLTLEKDKFYILSTKEKIKIPTSLSAEMIPFSQHVGELRAHYAGFFDPGFGCVEEGEPEGTVGVLEVRPHETITVYDGQPICLMEFYYNAKRPDKPYGLANNNYLKQTGPKLAKFFY